MGNTQRRLNIALAVDANGMDAGIQAALGKSRQYAEETKKLNDQVAAARAKYQDAKSSGAPDWQVKARKDNLDFARWSRDQSIATQRLQTSLDETYYRSTHTNLEVQLRERELYYANLRAMHVGNAEMMTRIDRTQAAETARLQEMYGGSEGMPWAKRIFSKKSPIKHMMKMGIEQAGWSIGPEVGLVGSMAMHGGSMLGSAALPMAGLAVAVGAAVVAYKAYNDVIEQTKKATKEFGDQIAASRERAEKVYGDTHGITGREHTQERLSEARKAIDDVSDRKTDKHGWTDTYYKYMKMGWDFKPKETPGDILTKQAEDQKNRDLLERQKQYKDLVAQGQREDAVDAERRVRDAQSPVDQARIAGMYEGPTKRKAEMIQRQANELLQAQQENYVKPGSVDESKIQERHAIENKNRERADRDEVDQQRIAARNAVISATMEGYSREMALLREKHQQERDEYTKAGKDMTLLVVRQLAEQAAVRKQRDRRVADLKADLERTTDVITHRKSGSDAEWEQMARGLTRELGLTGQALDQVEAKFRRMATARANQPLIDEMRQLSLSTEYARRQVSELDAERARLAWANPEASPDVIEANARAKETLRIAQFSRGEGDKLHPTRGYDDYKKNVMAGVDSGDLSRTDAEDLLKGKLREITNDGAGQSTDAMSHIREIQQGLIGGDDTPKQTVEELKGLRTQLETLLREGLPLKG